MVPAYGPNWRHKVIKVPTFVWRRWGWEQFGKIKVAPWNYKRNPIKKIQKVVSR